MAEPDIVVGTDWRLIAAVAAACAAFASAVVGPLISARIAKKQNDVALEVARMQASAPIKEKWINDIRSLIAEYIHLSTVTLEYFSEIEEGDSEVG
jgi:hypothetical protein